MSTDAGPLALFRELRAIGAWWEGFGNTRGTISGRPVIYRNRWLSIPHTDGELPHVVVRYQNWPVNDTYDVHAWWGVARNDKERLLMPVVSFADVLQLWADIKQDLERWAPVTPVKLGQLDIFDLIGAS